MSEEKPAALKTDDNGHCIHVCRIGQLEYIHRLITEDGLSQQEACRNFIDAVKAHVNEGDPIVEDMTIERVRSQFRRDSGKLIDKPKKSLVGPTNEVEDETASTDAGYQDDEKNVNVNTVVKNIEASRKQISRELKKLIKLIKDKKLTGGEFYKEIENQVRLLIYEAEDLRIYPFGKPIDSFVSPGFQTNPDKTQVATTEVVGA